MTETLTMAATVLVGACLATVLVIPARWAMAPGRLFKMTPEPITQQHHRQLPTDRCRDCSCSRDDHSQILVGAPCLACDCWAWAEPEPDPLTHDPTMRLAQSFGDLMAALVTRAPNKVCPRPRALTFDETMRYHRQIRSRAAPSTAELWQDGQQVQ